VSGIIKAILLPAAIVDEIIHHSSRQQYWFDNT
jgi:hypothetical protein